MSNSPLSSRYVLLCQLADAARHANNPKEAAALYAEAHGIAQAVRDEDEARVPYRCVGGYCGAEDCATCHPGSWDKDEDREREVASLCEYLDEIIARARGEVAV